MRQQRRTRRLLALLIGLSLFAASCGDDDDETKTGDEETNTTEAEGDEVDPSVAAALEIGDADPSCEGETDGILRIGGLSPQTGDLAILGPPIVAGTNVAVAEVNAAGGVLGQPIEYLPGDSGDADPDIANPTVDGHLAAGADAILGAASSGVSLNVIEKIIADCKIQFSPSNTSPALTTYEDDDLYFRTAPSDIIQGKVLAELALEDGVTTAAILARQDSYGEGLANYVEKPFTAAGGEVVVNRVYDPDAQDFSAEIDEIVAEDPDALFMIGFDETSRIMPGLFEEGFTPDAKQIYWVDGNTSNSIGADFDSTPGILEGIQGTYPAADASGLRDRMLATDPALVDFLYGPEAYDAVILMALAAEAAGSDNPAEIARFINSTTRDGEKCTSFAQCRDLLAAGTTDIDYDGASGPLDFGKPGEPQAGTVAIVSFGADNRYTIEGADYRFAEISAD